MCGGGGNSISGRCFVLFLDQTTSETWATHTETKGQCSALTQMLSFSELAKSVRTNSDFQLRPKKSGLLTGAE